MDWRFLFAFVFVLHSEITKASHDFELPKIKYKINYIHTRPTSINRVLNIVRRHKGHRNAINFLKEARSVPNINDVLPASQIQLDREHERNSQKHSHNMLASGGNNYFLRRALDMTLADRLKKYRNAKNKRPRHAEEGLNTEEVNHPGNSLFSLKSKTLLGAAKFPKKKADHGVYGNLDTLGLRPLPQKRRPLKRRPLNAARNPELLFDPDHPGLSLVNSKTMMLGAARFGRQGKDKDTSVYGNLENLGIRYEKEPIRFKYSDFRRANKQKKKRKKRAKKHLAKRQGKENLPVKPFRLQKSAADRRKKTPKHEEDHSPILFIDGKNTQDLFNHSGKKRAKELDDDDNKSHYSFEYNNGRRSKARFSRIGAREPKIKRFDRSYEVPIRQVFVSRGTKTVKPKTRPARNKLTGREYHNRHDQVRPNKKKLLKTISRTLNNEFVDQEASEQKKRDDLMANDPGKFVYGHLGNLGIGYGKQPYFLKYSDFRKQSRKPSKKNDFALKAVLKQLVKNGKLSEWKISQLPNVNKRQSNAIISLLNDASRQTRYNTQPAQKYNTKIIVDAVLRAIKNSNDVNSHLYYKGDDLVTQAAVGPSDLNAKKLNFRPLIDFLNNGESDLENDAGEILDESHSFEEGDYFTRRSKDYDKRANCSKENSDSSDSSESSSSNSEDTNPGNPYTIFKNKYKQNWLWNHQMTGDHMNVNPYGPKFDSLGPSGAELFFGRKWWYYNQDDYKPFRR